MSEIKPTTENLCDPYVLQLIMALSGRDDEIERLTEQLTFAWETAEGSMDRIVLLTAVKDAAHDYIYPKEVNGAVRIDDLRLREALAAVDKGDA